MKAKERYPELVGLDTEAYEEMLMDPEKRTELIKYYFESSIELAQLKKERDTVYNDYGKRLFEDRIDIRKIASAIASLKQDGELYDFLF